MTSVSSKVPKPKRCSRLSRSNQQKKADGRKAAAIKLNREEVDYIYDKSVTLIQVFLLATLQAVPISRRIVVWLQVQFRHFLQALRPLDVHRLHKFRIPDFEIPFCPSVIIEQDDFEVVNDDDFEVMHEESPEGGAASEETRE